MNLALLSHCLKRLALFANLPEDSLQRDLPRVEEIVHAVQWAIYGEALQPGAEAFDTYETLLVKNRLLLGRALAAEEALHTGAPGNSVATRDDTRTP